MQINSIKKSEKFKFIFKKKFQIKYTKNIDF